VSPKKIYENARAEIVNLKDNIVSLQRPNAAALTSGGDLTEQLQAKKRELERAHNQMSALHAMNRRLDGQKAVSPNSGSNEVAMLEEKISVLQEHVAQVPKLHKKNRELLGQLQIARDKIASLPRSLDREHRRATDLKDELEAKARDLEQERVKYGSKTRALSTTCAAFKPHRRNASGTAKVERWRYDWCCGSSKTRVTGYTLPKVRGS
jgi:chromosome segregation ATPase